MGNPGASPSPGRRRRALWVGLRQWEILGPHHPLGDADELCGWVSVRGIFSGQQCPCVTHTSAGGEVPREQGRGLLVGGLVVESVWVAGPMRVPSCGSCEDPQDLLCS